MNTEPLSLTKTLSAHILFPTAGCPDKRSALSVNQEIRGAVMGKLSDRVKQAQKAAMCALTDACFDPGHVLYGSRPRLYTHDEIIAELPEDKAHECAFAMRDIMVSEFQKWVPDVKVSAEPALMRHWFKSAETTPNE